MIEIELSDDPKQLFKLPLANNETATMFLYYVPTQYSWFFNLEYKNKRINGNKLVLGDNILRVFKNTFPFGLSVKANKSIEAFSINDFKDKRVKISVLEKREVDQIESVIFGL